MIVLTIRTDKPRSEIGLYKLDLRRMAGLAEADSAELKTVLLAGKVSKDTLTDKKQFLASRAESGSMAVLCKSSIDDLQLSYEEWEAHRQLAETLHGKIQQLLEAQHMHLSDIKGIVVFEGPGSFTGLRIGISVANALSYGLKIPVIGTQTEDWIGLGITSLKSGNNALPVTPLYGSDANITTPKK